MTSLGDGIEYLGTEQSLEGWSYLFISSIFLTCLVQAASNCGLYS